MEVRPAVAPLVHVDAPDAAERANRAVEPDGEQSEVGRVLVVEVAQIEVRPGREHRAERQAELAARGEAIRAAREHLDRIAAERGLSEDVVAFLNARHEHRERLMPADLDGMAATRIRNDLRLELIAAEREFLYGLLRNGKITDESRRRLERDLDLEEAAILARREGEMPL